jgi:hypothetical protein
MPAQQKADEGEAGLRQKRHDGFAQATPKKDNEKGICRL